MKLPTFLASLSLLSLTALAGCPASDAHFADATDAQIARSYSAASGQDLASALFIGIIFSGAPTNTESCPTIVTSGNDTTVAGGCDDEDGTHWDGTIVAHNMPGFLEANPEYDATEPSTVTFNQLHITATDGESRIDGVVSYSEADAHLEGDLTIDFEGIETTVRMTLECTPENLCTPSEDAEIEISDLGGASIDGSWGFQPPAGAVALHGADDLTFDLAATDADGCVPYSGAKSGLVCSESEGDDQGFAKRSMKHQPAWASRITRTANR
jgi:hypothetical protein